MSAPTQQNRGVAGWRRVSFAGDCVEVDEDYEEIGEIGNVCSVCNSEYATCPGPTQDGMEYETFDGVLMARPICDSKPTEFS